MNLKNKMIKQIFKIIRDYSISIITFCKILFLRYKKRKKSCLIITNGMGYGGAPLVLLEVAKNYRNQGYKVIVVTEHYGPLIRVFQKEKISIWITPKYQYGFKKLILKCNFSFVFVNTITLYQWIEYLEFRSIPALWWIHESDSYVKQLCTCIPKKLTSTRVLTVSERTVSALRKYNINYSTDMLYYGLDDLSLSKNDTHETKHSLFTYLVLGAICKRKNQLEAINAYNRLPDSIKQNSTLLFIGEAIDGEENYYQTFIKTIASFPNIKYLTKINRDAISELFKTIDTLICCSIDDPLPVVVTESFMFGKLVILSSKVGQYSLIKDGYNGYTYSSGNADELKEKMLLAWENRDNIQSQAIQKLYQYHFSKERFEEQLCHYTKSLLQKSSNTSKGK